MQVESCLNSHPLVPLSSHSDDGISALTPGHFFIGKPLWAYPEDTVDLPVSLRCRWNLCQHTIKDFWRCWSTEYLQQLQRSQKWRTPQTDLQPRNIVVVREDAWPLARITETFPGQDGRVRVARLKTSDSVFKRLTKLALILCDDAPSPSTVKDHGPVGGGGGGGGRESMLEHHLHQLAAPHHQHQETQGCRKILSK